MVGRTPAAARRLASRARRRLRGSAPVPDADLALQREVVGAFMAASRAGDFEALVGLLDPDVVLRADTGAGPPGLSAQARGARTVAGRAMLFRRFAPYTRLALVNGTYGIVTAPEGRLTAVMSLTITGGRIVEIDILADPARLEGLEGQEWLRLATFD